MNVTATLVVGAILIGAGAILHMGALNNGKYSVLKNSGGLVYKGPAEECLSLKLSDTFSMKKGGSCHSVSLSSMEASRKALVIFAWLAVPLSFGATIIVIVNLVLYVLNGKLVDMLTWLTGVGAGLAGIVVLVSLVLWIATEHDADLYELGNAFFMSIVAGCLMIIGGGEASSVR